MPARWYLMGRRIEVFEFLRNDGVLAGLMDEWGELPLKTSEDVFDDLVRAIISQQLSVRAADTIHRRMLELWGGRVDADRMMDTSDEKFRRAGVSRQKAGYLRSLAERHLMKPISFERFQRMTDDEVVSDLTEIKGVGVWTAQMILMFSLGREDVFSSGDLGIRNAMWRLYFSEREERPKPEELDEFAVRWKPYRTIACRYLWKSLSNEPNVSGT